jgi:hypothetical protein
MDLPQRAAARNGGAQLQPKQPQRRTTNARRSDVHRSSTARAQQPTPEQVFRLRCWAQATLYAAGELDLIEAVDALQAAAVSTGLVESIGQDAVQAIMAEAFEGAPDASDAIDEPPAAESGCCPTCGTDPCTNPSFCALCRRIDAGQGPR